MTDITPVVMRNMNRKNNIRSVYTRDGQDTRGLFVRPADVLTQLVLIYVVSGMLE